jgi:hypothetical protein
VKQPPKKYPKLEKGGEMAIGGKLKELLSKAKSATIKGYDKTKDYTKKQIHEQKRKVALNVIDDTKKKFKDTDLSKIFVQMKLTVIKDPEQKNIEVPNISRFANSQNKVDEADFSSSNPFLVKIENLSRKKYVINPDNKNQSRKFLFPIVFPPFFGR